MEEQLKLYNLECDSCGSTLARANIFEIQIKCPYCGTLNEVAGVLIQEVAMPERMILFQKTETDFKNAICNYFIKKDYVVNDIFEKIQMKNATPIYLPMFLYEGKYEANYSYSVSALDVIRRGANYNLQREMHDGVVKNRYAFLCLAYDGPEIAPELAAWTKTFSYDPVTAKVFDTAKLKNILTLPHNIDKEATWHTWGREVIERQAARDASKQLAYNGSVLQITLLDYDEKHEGRLILVPFWFVHYMYSNQKHYVMYDGLGRDIRASIPLDKERIKLVETLKNLRSTWSLVIGILAAILSGALLFVVENITHAIENGFLIGGPLIVGFACWLGLCLYSYSRETKLIEGSRKIRQAAFDRIVRDTE